MSHYLGLVASLSLLGIALKSGEPKSYRKFSGVGITHNPPYSKRAFKLSPRVINCPENRCLTRPFRKPEKNSERLYMYGCFCDDKCVKFGDCCHDAGGVSKTYEEITCAALSEIAGPPNTFVYMKSQCPTSWSHEATRRVCLSQSTSLYEDPLASLPVTSVRSGYTYRNAACARCHTDTDGAMLWNVEIQCPGTLEGNKEALRRIGDGEWGLTTNISDFETFRRCNIKLVIPMLLDEGNHIRSCLPAVSDCMPNWTDRETAAECGAYTARVRDESKKNTRARSYGHIYRNPHCALCNDVPLDNIGCGKLRRHRLLAGRAHLPSFSALFDFSDHSGGGDVGDRCHGTGVWDPFSQKCRNVFCDDGNVLEDDKCVPQIETFSDQYSTKSFSFRLCPKFYVSPDEYENRSDGKVLVRPYNRVYADGEFEFRGDELIVCSHFSNLSKFNQTLRIFSLMFIAASVICLCCHLALFCLVPEQRNLPGKNLAALCACLLLGYVCFLITSFQEAGTGGCRASGIVMYAAFIASFLWMNVMAFDIFTSLRLAVREFRVASGRRTRQFLLYSTYTLAMTACLVTAAVIKDASEDATDAYRPAFGERVCWFSRRRALVVFFAVPLFVIMTANVALFFGSWLILHRSGRSATCSSHRLSKTNLRLCWRLAVICGLSWILGLVAGWFDFPLLWPVSTIVNTLQGVFIYVSFTMRGLARSRARHRASRCAWQSATGASDGRSETPAVTAGGPVTSETQI